MNYQKVYKAINIISSFCEAMESCKLCPLSIKEVNCSFSCPFCEYTPNLWSTETPVLSKISLIKKNNKPICKKCGLYEFEEIYFTAQGRKLENQKNIITEHEIKGYLCKNCGTATFI